MAKTISSILLFSTIFILGQGAEAAWRQLSSCQVDFPAASGYTGDKICGACFSNGNKDCGGPCQIVWEYSVGGDKKVYWTLCSHEPYPCTLKLTNFSYNDGTFFTEYEDGMSFCERTYKPNTRITLVHATCCKSLSK